MKNNILTKLLSLTFIRFAIVGVINTVVGTSVMLIAYNIIHLSYWVSSALNYVIGSIVSYFLNKYFTFKTTKKSIRYIIKFIINIVICYGIAYGVARPLVAYMLSNASLVIRDNVAMMVGMVLFVIINYFGQRFFVFTEEND